jgi:carbonic anhydrase
MPQADCHDMVPYARSVDAMRCSIPSCLLLVVMSSAPAPATSDAPGQGPEVSLDRLRAGNARFAADPTIPLPIEEGRRAQLTGGQAPFAGILSCADSRVPPEVVFNTGLGDLFVVRAAGEVVDRSVLASLEYGAEHLHLPVIVVMGHESCGAVKTAVEVGPTARSSLGPNLDYLVKAIQPAVARAARSLFEEPLKAAVLANVEQIVTDLQTQSGILRQFVDAGKLQIVGAYYELGSGHVTFSQPVRTSRKTKPAAATAHAAHKEP